LRSLFARKDKYQIEANQEMVAIGLSNMLNSFFSGFPVTGSFSRSSVLNQSGVRTPLAGIFTASLVLLAVEFLTAAFSWIPVVALASIIIGAVVPMFDYEILPQLWHASKGELLLWIIAFLSCLAIGVEYGILVGVGLSFLHLFYKLSRPREQFAMISGVFFWTFVGPFCFHSAPNFTATFLESFDNLRLQDVQRVIFDCKLVTAVDLSGLNNIEDLIGDLHNKDMKLFFVNVHADVFIAMEAKGLDKLVGAEGIHLDFPPSLLSLEASCK